MIICAACSHPCEDHDSWGCAECPCDVKSYDLHDGIEWCECWGTPPDTPTPTQGA